jgi:hypothetical protein
MPCSIPPSKLAEFIAKFLGQLESRVYALVLKEVSKIQQKLLGSICPPVEEIEKILKVRDNLLNAINGLEKKIEPVKKFADILDPPIKAAKVTVTVLEMISIPGTIGLPPGPSGGVIFSVSIGAQNRFSQLLNLACQIVDMLYKDQQAIKDLTDLGFSGLEPLKAKLESIDIKLWSCVENLPQEDKDRILAGIENLPSNAGLTNQIDSNVFSYFKPNPSGMGTVYTIRILVDKNSPVFAPRRYAVVENAQGVVVLKGPPSFSSSTRILVDEIKFRINNQLP